MRDEARYYRSVLDNLSGGFISVDLAGDVVYANPTAGRILRLTIGAMLGQPYQRALEPYPELLAVVGVTLETRASVHRAEVTVKHGDAAMIIGYSTLQVRTPEGESLGIGIIFQDLTLIQGQKAARAAP